jgi:DNA-directed RNA polymerase I subunit RPA1
MYNSQMYGGQAAGALITAFSRLMTNFLQWEGFTLGVKDVLVTHTADDARQYFMIEAGKIGTKAAANGVSLPEDSPEEMIYEKLEEVHRSRDPKRRAFVDLCYKRSLDQHTNSINK